mmetsp:Transcript_28821/g.59150  ORF Transcript_28821/g.59150 Transcript_28821/m.59150 type:complete len:643 (-) Transcript_28821:534-2462(-)
MSTDHYRHQDQRSPYLMGGPPHHHHGGGGPRNDRRSRSRSRSRSVSRSRSRSRSSSRSRPRHNSRRRNNGDRGNDREDRRYDRGGRDNSPRNSKGGGGELRSSRDWDRRERSRSRDKDSNRNHTRNGNHGNDSRKNGDAMNARLRDIPRDGHGDMMMNGRNGGDDRFGRGPDDRRDFRDGMMNGPPGPNGMSHYGPPPPRGDFDRPGNGKGNGPPHGPPHGHPNGPPRGPPPGPQRGPPPPNNQTNNPAKPPQFNSNTPSHTPVYHSYRVNPNARPDDKLNQLSVPAPENEDPRGEDPTKRITKNAKRKGSGMNTESFDPASTLVRPDLRIWVGSRDSKVYERKLKHDDVVMVPELFGPESNWDLYYKLVEEMRSLQKENKPGSEWISWHEGAHLISKNPQGSPTFEMVIDRLCEYFKIEKKSIGTRFNWYRDSSDWKPFHHDSAAYNPHRARNQNITVGVSFGACRELAFLRASPLENGDKVKVYFPQTNNGVFSFGRDVNILWKHGVNALAEEDQDGKGRISIILWGLAKDVVEEKGSPPLLGSDGQGSHASRRNDRRGSFGDDRRRGGDRRGRNDGGGSGNGNGNSGRRVRDDWRGDQNGGGGRDENHSRGRGEGDDKRGHDEGPRGNHRRTSNGRRDG